MSEVAESGRGKALPDDAMVEGGSPLQSRHPRGLASRFLRSLLQVTESPERTALGFAVGVFLGFSPLLGLHTILGLLVAHIVGFNRMVMLAGIYSCNPWILVPYYGFATWFGIQILGVEEGHSLESLNLLEIFQAEFWQVLASEWRLLLPACVGSTILCTLLALIAYPVALHIVQKYRRLKRAPSAVSDQLE